MRPSLAEDGQYRLLLHYPSTSEAQLATLLSQSLADAASPPSDAPVRIDEVAALLGRLRLTQLAFLSCALVALAVSALGILNVGLASVRERSRELFIRRAVGATRSQTFLLVLVSALMVAAMAGMVAVAACYAAVRLYVPRLLSPELALHRPTFPASAALAGITVAIAAALLGSIIPAAAAARQSIGDALRD
ncbi:MAG: ABC transporter permease [Jatrophihabitans sp.]